MVIAVAFVLSLAAVTAAILTGTTVFAYVGIALALLALLPLAWRTWQDAARRRSSQRQQRPNADDDQDADNTHDVPQDSEDQASAAADIEPTSDTTTTAPPAADTQVQMQGVTTVTAGGVEPADPDAATLVHVIPGRKRFHREGCALLEGHSREKLTLVEAREEGFSPCSRCATVGAASASPGNEEG
ncbi:hypothetical protein SAMN06265360_111145 [Haloechinothrix alba]|uniref:Ada DNA repair metal-binding domain-containing protein n=1 Tax=Haloechinothrix alba TaxID=664784 RepID=A0A238XP43_9PSEU|nr:hypothetical protein [Haloechinothrix alba]SNR60311.1 hypothetical protein SAMN06265360_111145 [Haloechinothrix alba]